MRRIRLEAADYPLRSYEVDMLGWLLRRRGFEDVGLSPSEWAATANGHSPADLEQVLSQLPFVDHFELLGKSRATMAAYLEMGAGGSGRRSRTQAHTYLVHGLHQYRGKFYPQIARSLILAADLEEDEYVLDPFMGSGTTLIEAALLGYNSVGLDLSPMAHFIARAKATLLQTPPSQYLADVELAATNAQDHLNCTDPHGHVPASSYLARWFDPVAARRLDCALDVVQQARTQGARLIVQLSLSRRLREWSLQLPEDLRIRRRADPPDTTFALNQLGTEALAMAQRLTQQWPLIAGARLGSVHTLLADARTSEWSKSMAWARPRVGAIVTSPPYATALPYIDTDRLSLVALGLAEDTELRVLEEELIGSREIATSKRRSLEAAIASGLALPEEVRHFLEDLAAKVAQAGDSIGFRRRNMPALLARYFLDMDACARGWREMVRPGALVSIVVGDSRTKLANEWLTIPTRRLTVAILAHHGFEPIDQIDLTDQPAYSIHRANVIKEESILVHRLTDTSPDHT